MCDVREGTLPEGMEPSPVLYFGAASPPCKLGERAEVGDETPEATDFPLDCASMTRVGMLGASPVAEWSCHV